MKNPFVTNGYAGPEYFCDRVQETRTMIQWLTNENNMALISPRRIGKTELIHHCFQQPEIRQHYYTFIIDIYSTNSVADMVNMFGKAILDELKPRGRVVWERFLAALASVRSEISFDINGQPSWGIGLGAFANPQTTLDEIFSYLAQADKPCLVAIDEFQQITNYRDPNIEALLRTYVQRCTNAHFVFSGSQRHLMAEMFLSPARPFYQQVSILNLKPLDVDKYTAFAIEKFGQNGKQLSPDVPQLLFQRFEAITQYVQKTMNLLFLKTPSGGTCMPSMVDEAVAEQLNMASDTYEALLRQMPEKQQLVLKAICAERRARSITGGKFVHKYRLPSASAVRSAARGLLEKDFITQVNDEYMVYDKFFDLWLLRRIS